VRRSVVCVCSLKNLASLVITVPITSFPSERTGVNHLYSTLTNCTSSGCFNVCHLRRPSSLPLDATNDCHWFFHFFISYMADVQMLHEGTTTLRYLPLSRTLIVSSSWAAVNVTHFLLPVARCSLTVWSLEPLQQFKGLSTVQTTQEKVKRSVTDGTTFGRNSQTSTLGTILLKWWTVKISGLSAALFKEFYCVPTWGPEKYHLPHFLFTSPTDPPLLPRSERPDHLQICIPYYSVDNAHPKLFRHSFWLHSIYLSYLSNVYRACPCFMNLDLLYR
jgi:hypothetical protein